MSELQSVKCPNCGTRSWDPADVKRGGCGNCRAPTASQRHRPKLKNAVVAVALILGAGLLYGFRGYTRPWIHGEPIEERVEGGLIGFGFGIAFGIVVVVGVLVYERWKDRWWS